MKFSLRLLLVLIILSPLYVLGQMSSATANRIVPTAYTNGVPNDDIFVFCDPEGTARGEITARPADGSSNRNFHWEKFDAASNSFQFLSDELGVSQSTISNLLEGGYKVTIKNAAEDTTIDCFRAWVFLDSVFAEADTIIPTCQPFPLSGSADVEDFHYYNSPPHPFLIDDKTEITVCFDAIHDYVSDLGFYLIGPPSCGSPRIEIGAWPTVICNSGDNVTNLCYSTTGVNNLDVCSGGPPDVFGNPGPYPTPLTGTFASDAPWNPLFGCDATLGGWRVQIYDCENLNSGRLTGARITFSGNSDCGPNPTVVNYDSGPINSPINDNSCDPGSASIYEVPITPATALVKTNSYTVEWTCSDPSFIIANPTSLNTTVTPTKKHDAWFVLSVKDNIGRCIRKDSTFYKYKPANAPTIDPLVPICNNAVPTALTAGGQTGVWRSAGVPDSTVGSFDPTLVTPGYHIIEFEDDDICGGITQDSILVYDLPIINLTQDDSICRGDSTQISFNITGGGLPNYDITVTSDLGNSKNYTAVASSFSDWFSPLETEEFYV